MGPLFSPFEINNVSDDGNKHIGAGHSPCSSLYYAGSNDLRFSLLFLSLLIPLSINVYVRAERWHNRQICMEEEGSKRCSSLRSKIFSKSVILPVYDYVLWLSVVTAGIRAILDVINQHTDHFTLDSRHVYFWLLWGFGLQGSRQFSGSVVAFLLVQRSSGAAAFRRAAIGAACMLLFTGIVVGALQHLCDKQTTLMSLFLLLDVLTVLLYSGLLTFTLLVRRRRWRFIYGYLVFQVIVNVLYAIGSASMLTKPGPGVPHKELCLWTTGDLLIILIQPFLILYTLKDDSRYWRSLATIVGAAGTRGSTDVFEGTIRFVSKNSFSEMGEFLAMEIKLLDFSKLYIFEGLGSGTSASVFRAGYGKREVAVKSLDFQELTGDVVRGFCQEAILSFRLSHRNVVRFFGVCLRPPELFLVFEYCRKGSLRRVLDSKQKLSVSTRVQLALDIAEGMSYLHKRRIVHRDLKSTNVLVQEDPETGSLVAKIADFGLSRILLTRRPPMKRQARSDEKGTPWDNSPLLPGAPSLNVEEGSTEFQRSMDTRDSKGDNSADYLPISAVAHNGSTAPLLPSSMDRKQLTTAVGTIEYLAPELLSEISFRTRSKARAGMGVIDFRSTTVFYGYEVDVYAFSIVMWELATRRYPYDTVERARDVQQMVLAGLRLRLPMGSHVPEGYAELMNDCWQEDPVTRPTFAYCTKVLKVVWFNDCAAYEDDSGVEPVSDDGKEALFHIPQSSRNGNSHVRSTESMVRESIGDGTLMEQLLEKKETM
ncbi:hypothetical protein AAMO2058_000721500 [Amorphochlora amoebiformis]